METVNEQCSVSLVDDTQIVFPTDEWTKVQTQTILLLTEQVFVVKFQTSTCWFNPQSRL